MPNNIKIADKPTLDEVKIITEDIDTKIGDPTDLEIAGSVMGKLNKVLADASTNMGYVMEGETVTVTISTASFTSVASGTKVQKVGNFQPAHSGIFDVVVRLQTLSNNSSAYTVYVSTTSTTNPSVATLESTKKGVSVEVSSRETRNPIIPVYGCQLTANTNYYIHIVCTDSGSSTGTVTINEIEAGGTYATNTPCQSVIKSIQHGIWDGGAANIPLQKVAPQKCLVLCGENHDNFEYILLPEMLKIYLRTSMDDNQNLKNFNWQVIEFY